MAKISFQPHSNALPPIKLDGKVYVVIAGTYQRLLNEKIITARYTSDGEIDLQKLDTEKHRWKMTLMVPAATENVGLVDCPFSVSDMGTMTSLQATDDKLAPNDLLDFYDITSDWDFSGNEEYNVYLDKMDFSQPNNNDIGIWQVPISLWGYDRPILAALGGLTLDGWAAFVVQASTT